MKFRVLFGGVLLSACTEAPRPQPQQPVPDAPDMASPAAADLTGVVNPNVDLAQAALTLGGITPSRASTVGRDQITLTGSGFVNGLEVTFGGVRAEIVSVSATQVVVLAPPNIPWGAPTSVAIRRLQDGARVTNTNTANSPTAFSYYASQLAFTLQGGSFNPQNLNNARYPLIGDFNNDGRPDLISTYISNANFNVYLNSGGGNFVNVANPGINLGVQKGAVADLDADGNMDAIVADESGTWGYYLGLGDGRMTSRGNATFAPGCSGTTSPTPIKLSSNMYFDVAVACINNNNIRIWNTQYNGGNPGSMYPGTNQVTLSTLATPQHLQAVDVNNDGKQDLVVVNQAANVATLSWYINQGTTLPTSPTNSVGINNNSQNPYWVRCADLNGDNFPDCVVSDISTNTLRIFMNNAGALQAPSATTGTLSVGQEPREVNLADMNGDGLLDIVVSSRQLFTFQVIPGKGDGTFGNQTSVDGRVLISQGTFATPNCRYGWTAQVADFDGDGYRDVITSCDQNFAGQANYGGFYIFKNISR